MESPRFAGSVRRITILEKDRSGAVVAVTVYRRARARKKGSRLLRPLETAVRRWAEATESYASQYLDEHRKSSRKRGDGWLRDLPENTLKASRKGAKRLKAYRVFGL
jgi:hypothetical protein